VDTYEAPTTRALTLPELTQREQAAYAGWLRKKCVNESSKRINSLRSRSYVGAGRSGGRDGSSGDASPLPVENENIIGGERAYVPGPPVGVQKFHLEATIGKQLDDGAHVTRLDLRIARAGEHGDHIQQLQFSCVGHINRRSRVGRLTNIAGDQARNRFVDPDDPRRTNGGGAVRAFELEVDDIPAAVLVRFADGCVSGLGSIAKSVEQETRVGTVQANQRLEESSLVAAVFMNKVEAVVRNLSLIDDGPPSVGQLQTSPPCRLSPRTIVFRRSSLRRRFSGGGQPRGIRLMIRRDRRGVPLAG